MSEEDRVEVRLWLPRKVAEWFRQNWEEEDLQRCFLETLRADLDAEPFLDVEGQEALQDLEKEVAKLDGEPWKPWEIDPERARKTEVAISIPGFWADRIKAMLKRNLWLPQDLGEYFLSSARNQIASDLTASQRGQ